MSTRPAALRDQIIALFEELAIPFVDRDGVRREALAIAARGDVSGRDELYKADD
jgi:hypothetical protein